MIIKILIIAFVLYILGRTYQRWQKKDISGREFFIWLIFWLAVCLASLWPQKTDVVAQFLGVSRGADLLIYVSIIVLFFIVFKIIVRQEKTERTITKLIRQEAIDDQKNEEK